MTNLIKEMASEVSAYYEAQEIADKLQTNDAWAIEDKAFAAMLDARRNEAATALHYRAKVTQEQHDSADQNAIDTLNENGINPDCDAGKLLYYRLYVSGLQLFV